MADLSPAELEELRRRACPDATAEIFFRTQMAVAEKLGMSYVDSLRHVILQREWNGGLVAAYLTRADNQRPK